MRRARRVVVSTMCAGLSAWAGAAGAQQPAAVVRLDRPERVLPQPFSLLRGLRELPDGRVLVSDFIEDRTAVVDFAEGTVTDRNRMGAGPEEFRLPGTLLPFRGDSTILLDAGNSRLDVMDCDGRIVRAFRPSVVSAVSPGGADARGRLFFTVPPWNTTTPLRGDSVELGIWDPATDAAKILTRVHGSTAPPASSPTQEGPRIPFVVFARQDSWAVAPDGRLAIVRGGDYSVQWMEGDRVLAAGPSYAYRARRVTGADRTAYTRQFMAGSAMSGKGPNGAIGHVPASELSGEAVARTVRSSTFADVLPYFRAGDVRIDAAGRLWVGRTSAPAEARRYDIFDRAGKMIGAVQLAPGRRVIGFGAKHVFIVRANEEDGLETLERHAMPALPG